MAQPRRWLWGLVPLALLWGAGNLFLDDAIERDVARRAVAAATSVAGEAPGARPIVARVVGRDVAISGEALSADGATRAMAQLRSEFGVRRALGGLSQVVAQRPYSWSATRQDAAVTLNGFVPDMATAMANVAAAGAALPGLRIDDRQNLAFGAPPGFQQMTTAILAELPKLSAGKVALDDSRFCIEGRAQTPQNFLSLQEATSRLAQGGFQAVPCGLDPPVVTPYRWSAERTTDEAVDVTGFYPSEEVRQQILAVLRRAFPGPVRIDDRMLPALGAARRFSRQGDPRDRRSRPAASAARPNSTVRTTRSPATAPRPTTPARPFACRSPSPMVPTRWRRSRSSARLSRPRRRRLSRSCRPCRSFRPWCCPGRPLPRQARLPPDRQPRRRPMGSPRFRLLLHRSQNRHRRHRLLRCLCAGVRRSAMDAWP